MIRPENVARGARRAVRGSLAGLTVGLACTLVHGQTPAPEPLPPAWQPLGITQWPVPSAELQLEFDEIVLPGEVTVRVRSAARFTQTLALFRRMASATDSMEQVALKNLGPKDAPVLQANVPVTETQTLVALAKTPSGWVRQERQIKVGRPPQ